MKTAKGTFIGIVRLIVQRGNQPYVRHTARMRIVSLYHRHRFFQSDRQLTRLRKADQFSKSPICFFLKLS